MPEDKESALARGREAVITKDIQEAMSRLDAITVEVDAIKQLLTKIQTKEDRDKRTAKRAAKSR